MRAVVWESMGAAVWPLRWRILTPKVTVMQVLGGLKKSLFLRCDGFVLWRPSSRDSGGSVMIFLAMRVVVWECVAGSLRMDVMMDVP